jgi:acetyl-CoA acetyltransferase
MFSRARILGTGRTEFSRASGRSVLSLALQATDGACADAGFDARDLDGVVTYAIDDSIPALSVLNALGCPDIHWFNDLYGGGNVSLTALLQAAMVVEHGLADRVVVFRAINGRSESRLGGTSKPIKAEGGLQYTAPVGWTTYGRFDAMMARRHMEIYGTTTDHLGGVALAAREWAGSNPNAMMREPLTIEEYRRSPMVSDPFRLLDYCQESDCAFAVVIGAAGTSATPSREIEILSGAHGGGPRPGGDNWGHVEWAEHARTFSHYLTTRLYGPAGLRVTDLDLFYLYDCFTFSVLGQLEGFGLAKPGESGPLVASGATAPGGTVPVNTHGGLLSEGYGHGMNHVVEAVLQLRKEAGARQLANADRALVTGGATTTGCAVILGAAA